MNNFIKLQYGATIICGLCKYYDVYMIDVDEYRIELSDKAGMVIGTIDTDKIDECEVIKYDDKGIIEYDTNTRQIIDLKEMMAW